MSPSCGVTPYTADVARSEPQDAPSAPQQLGSTTFE